VDIDLEAGTFFTLVGPSGSGKDHAPQSYRGPSNGRIRGTSGLIRAASSTCRRIDAGSA